MSKVILLLCSIILSTYSSFANESCFIAKQNGKVLVEQGDCATGYSPCSSFKIVLALIGYDSGILKDENHPQWQFKPEYDAFMESWKDAQTPTSWMKNSCVWYSQVLTPELGMKKFQDYVKKFNYGNQDLSGDIGKNNGLTNAWLSSSLEISPMEQMVFLEQLLAGKLPVSKHAHIMTKKILYVEELAKGWRLYGKTGSGYLLNWDRSKTEVKHGWFIGWIEKSDQQIVFVSHLVDQQKVADHAGPRARAQAKENLLKLIEAN